HEFAARPGFAFDTRAAICYFRVMAELNSAGYPDWMIGSARASGTGAATAFITNECVRAILALRASMTMTADFCRSVCSYLQARARIGGVEAVGSESHLKQWARIERERIATRFVVDFNRYRYRILFEIKVPAGAEDDDGAFAPKTVGEVDEFVRVLRPDVR